MKPSKYRRSAMAIAFAVTAGAGVASVLPSAAAATSAVTFVFTGLEQTWTVPAGVTAVRVDVFGAQGGGDYGGFGAKVSATLKVTAGQQLALRVGGRGATGRGGFNGGGGSSFAGAGLGQGQGGGGASDVRSGDARLVVAGGGGGGAGGPTFGMGASAGGSTGEAGVNGSRIHTGGGGGTPTQPGSSGGAYAGAGRDANGGNGGFYGGGGGGGWFGGGGGGGDSSGGSAAGGGAGSSYAAPETIAPVLVQGARTGDGQIVLNWGSGAPAADAPQVPDFAYTGGPQFYQVPANVTAVGVRAIGAQGGFGTIRPGFGADVTATVAVTPDQVLAVMVGGQGGGGDGCGALSCGDPRPGDSIGGFNGGASNTFLGAGTGRGSGGGGATDLRRGSWRLEKRVIVAGGGGGGAINPEGTPDGLGRGGDAAGETGEAGVGGTDRHHGGQGGAPNGGGGTGGAYGGDGIANDGGSGGFFAGSGGGGWYGGGGGGGDSSGGTPGGGGAGSSHVTDPIGATTFHSYLSGGNGKLSLVIAGTQAPTEPVPTTEPTPTPTRTTPPGPPRYVALGDSYASGEGAVEKTFLEGTSFKDPNHKGRTIGCHRSRTSWAYPVFEKLKVDGQVREFRFVACSGGVFDNLYGTNRSFAEVGEIEDPQLNAVTSDAKVATLSMGGNNVGFEPVVRDCLTGAGGFGCRNEGTTANTTANAGLEQLRGQVSTPNADVPAMPVARIYAQIVERMAPGGTLYVTGYPHLFSPDKDRYPNWPILVNGRPTRVSACVVGEYRGFQIRISYQDAMWVNGLVDQGDAILKSAVGAANSYLASTGQTGRVVFVDVRSKAFDKHALCSRDEWFNGAEVTADRTPKRISFHPNAKGQQEYARLMLDAVSR
jgi:hypothetical protein